MSQLLHAPPSDIEQAHARLERMRKAHTEAAKRYAGNRVERLYEALPKHIRDPYPFLIRNAIADGFEAGKRHARKSGTVNASVG